MKFSLSFLLVFLVSISLSPLFSQSQYTPYDRFPGLIMDYKPAYESNFPEWGRTLYEYPINFNELMDAYERYAQNQPEVKNALTRYFKLWRRAVEPYAQPDGSIRLPDMDGYYEKLYQSQNEAFKDQKETEDEVWTFLGPKETFWLNESGSPQEPSSCPWQVNVYSFDVANSDNEILYAGTETGFVNKTTDGGLNWELLVPNYPFGGGVTAVAIDPEDAETVIVSAGNNLHKSTDGGESWTPLLPAGEQFSANRLSIDNLSPTRTLASASEGVFLSEDSGITWEQKWSSQAWDVEFKPDDQNILYALTRDNGNFALAVSTDGGINFNLESSFPSSIPDVSGGLLAVSPAEPDMLWVIMLSENNTPYLYRGEYINPDWTWEVLATGNTAYLQMNNGQGYFDLVLDVSPVDPDLIMVGTTTLYKSTNGGINFTAVGGYSGNFSIHPDIQDIKMLPNGNTWVSTDGGMNYTTDNFQLQVNYHARVNGLVGSDMWGFDQGWNEDIVVGGRYHNGNTAIADFYQPKALRMGGAESPTGWVIKGRSRHVAFNDLGNGWILPPEAEEAPEGRFIFSKYPNMDEYGGRRGNIATHPNYYGTFFLGEGNGFWKSTDLGESYDLLYTLPGRVRYLDVSYSNPEVLYADVVNYGLYRSDDGGMTWVLKPSLCSPPNGNSYWKGKLFFAISPTDENRLYACLQNGTWSADIGEVFMSTDGGESWENWTGTLSEYTKCLVVQPATEGGEIVYLFTNSRGGSEAGVYYRTAEMEDWGAYTGGYPSGMSVNLAMPFFRDGKIRVAGNAGIWEAELIEPEFEPIINPWVERPHFKCMLDTIYLEDHSIMNHSGAEWTWSISPEPEYLENVNKRNPKVVLGNPGSYDITLTVTKDGESYTRFIPGMITTTTCPSIEDCSNPAELPKEEWNVIYFDSQEVNYPGLASMSIDGDIETIWHTRWSTGNDSYPHEIQVDMGQAYRIFEFTYLTRQDGQNGRIKVYELYISESPEEWGDPVATGEWENTSAPQHIEFPDGVIGRYFRVLALSEVNGNPWASAAEFTMVGCTDLTSDVQADIVTKEAKAFPVPSTGSVTVSLPAGNHFDYQILNASGMVVKKGKVKPAEKGIEFQLDTYPAGVYFITFINKQGTRYNVKVVKE